MSQADIIPRVSGGLEEVLSKIIDAPEVEQTVKSPLRYPGGKTRAVDIIRQYIPHDTKKLCAPFLGGGSVELSCAADGIKVYGADAFEPVINFWKHAKQHPVLLSERVRKYHPLTKTKFYSLQRGFADLNDNLERAAVFYVLNRSSFSGTTLSGGMSPGHPRFTESSINRLRDFRARNIRVSHADYKETLKKHKDKFLYLDPPYANGAKLYGNKGNMHEGFDHEVLAGELRRRDGWVLSYNDNEQVRSLYKGYKIVTPRWHYGMAGDKRSKEVLILNV